MKHAGPESLGTIEPLLEKVRKHSALTEKKHGTFYRKSSAFLHFHEDPAGMFADVKIDGEFQRFRVSTKAEQTAFLREVSRELDRPAAPSRDTRRGG